MTFVKVGKNEFQVIYDELINRKYWDGPIGLKRRIDNETKLNQLTNLYGKGYDRGTLYRY